MVSRSILENGDIQPHLVSRVVSSWIAKVTSPVKLSVRYTVSMWTLVGFFWCGAAGSALSTSVGACLPYCHCVQCSAQCARLTDGRSSLVRLFLCVRCGSVEVARPLSSSPAPVHRCGSPSPARIAAAWLECLLLCPRLCVRRSSFGCSAQPAYLIPHTAYGSAARDAPRH
jgi:hypothetical protein